MSLDPLVLLAERFSAAISAAFPESFAPGEPAPDPLIAPAKNPQFGDFQSNAAMGLAKKLGKPPRDVAAAIVARADLGDLAEPLSQSSIAGPGFINIRLRGEALSRLLQELDAPHLGVPPAAEPQTVVVDLMGVNLAKQMHVGHLRSPIIGDALARTIERLGHRVVRQNHVGDWGLPIAMTTTRIIRLCDAGHLSLDRLTLDDLDKAYRDAQAECQRDTAGLDAARRFGLGPKALAELEEQVAGATESFMAARQTLLKLQAREEPVFGVWRRIYDVTMRVCIDSCRRLHVNVTEADTAGESSYAEEMPQVVADLVARGIAVEDQGALIVRLDDPPRGEDSQPLWEPVKEPVLVRKTDGGFLYATTDIAAIRRRVQKIGAHRIVYAIDARQSLQMRQVYAASIKAGYAIHPATRRPALMQHAAFGAVLGEDGRPFKTRSGESVKLADLLEETAGRAREAVRAAAERRQETLDPAELDRIGEAVGMAALKYADLSNDRTRDYVFSFDRMLAFEGNTGPYLLYALTRIRSILRKAAGTPDDLARRAADLLIADAAEKSLALALLRYPAAVHGVSHTLEPHRMCQYLYDLAGAYSAFYQNCPVLAAEDPAVRRSRLRLCDLTGRVLADGLSTLGIPTVEKM